MKILICDDEQRFIDILKDKIELLVRGQKVEIITVTSGKEVLKQKELDKLDAVFLDIEMSDMNGIEVADELRKFNQYMHIIFVSNREELVYQSLVYRPFRFIRKTKLDSELEEAVKALVKELVNDNQYIVVGNTNKSYKVQISDIMYMTSNKHDITIYTEDEIICVRDTMTRLDTILSEYYFIRIHAGYLVNPKYIYSIETKEVILDNKVGLPISRQKIAETKKRFFEYGGRGR